MNLWKIEFTFASDMTSHDSIPQTYGLFWKVYTVGELFVCPISHKRVRSARRQWKAAEDVEFSPVCKSALEGARYAGMYQQTCMRHHRNVEGYCMLWDIKYNKKNFTEKKLRNLFIFSCFLSYSLKGTIK